MRKQYENLMAVDYDKANNTYTLEFQDEDEAEFIEVDAKEHEQAKEDEFYFDNKNLVEQIIEENKEK